MVIVKDQLDPDLRKIIKKQNKAVIIPVGSIEQHGPHLPVSTDSDIVTEVAKRLSESVDTGKCAPCCSIDPIGITATCFFFLIDFLRLGSNWA